MAKASYEIRVTGEVTAGLLDDFEGVTTRDSSVVTTMHCERVDQATLQGLLRALRAAELMLVEVRRSPWSDTPAVD